ncbi:alpha/beta fold hydrolase [Rhizobium lusitanum]|uniref:alpha/beta fold hydrolase n=1 Tax=Rhizobium lusitanum TaxID=293958 RepID=UPI00195641E1|nr:alpha/beta hydrolase [Rhizobium lusitanum]MBM7044700.1 alpha/beta hydrolase [Rhizobium lusitanum]
MRQNIGTLFLPDMIGFQRTEYDIGGVHTVVHAIGQGRPLVFLHGAGTFPGFEFARRIAFERRVIIPYHPGFGESGDSDLMTSIDGVVRHYESLFADLGLDDFDLAGFSLGGWIAAEFAAQEKSGVCRLALIAPAGLVVPEHPVPDLSIVIPQDLPGYLTHDPQIAHSYFPTVPDPAFDRSLGREMAALGRLLQKDPQGDPKLQGLLHRIRVPTLLLWGADDRMRPAAQADAWLAALPDVRLHLFPETGHLVFEERPEAADALLLFFNT